MRQPRFINEDLKYLHPDKEILQNSKRIETQPDLNEAKEYWMKKLKMNKKIILDARLIGWNSILKYLRDFLFLLVLGGAFADVIKIRKVYKIRVLKCKNSAN